MNCNFHDGGRLNSAFWNSTHMRDVIHQQYFRRCNGAECQLPSNVIYRPLSCMGQLVNFPMNLPLVLPLHSACLLGDNYIFPWLRPDQMLPPWGLQLAAAGALVWECGMWLCVLSPGPLCALGLLAGFMFHQGVRWLTNIRFPGLQDVYLLSLPLLFGWLRGPGGVPKYETARGRARCNMMWDSRWRVAAFSILWGSLMVSPKTLPQLDQYPIAAYPHFCANSSGKASPTKAPVAMHMITDVKLTACESGSLLKSGLLVPTRWIQLHGGNAATGRCSSAFWQKLKQEVQKNGNLGSKRKGKNTCALFVVQHFALLMGTPLESQVRRDPPARLVLVNGTAVSSKAGNARAWSSCASRAVARAVKKSPAKKPAGKKKFGFKERHRAGNKTIAN